MGAKKDNSSSGLINQLSNLTHGQSISVVYTGVADDIVHMMSGLSKGAMGYGSAEYVFDFGEKINLSEVTVHYDLYPNTNGNWKIAVSDGGKYFTDYTNKFKTNYTATFDNVFARYVKFFFELYSGLSISSASADDGTPTTGTPVITDISFTYIPYKKDYIFVNTRTLTNQLDQISIATNSNINYWQSRVLNVGVATSDSISWDDYNSDAKPSKKENGKIVQPIRTGLITDDVRAEPLIRIDGYLFKTTNGKWNPLASVTITEIEDDVITEIESSQYKLLPREGLVIFDRRKVSGNYYINIVNSSDIRVGIEVLNATDNENTYLEGVSYNYTEREDS